MYGHWGRTWDAHSHALGTGVKASFQVFDTAAAALNPEPEGVLRMAGLNALAPAEPGRTVSSLLAASAASLAWPCTETSSAPVAPSPGDGGAAAARPCICFIVELRRAFSGSLP